MRKVCFQKLVFYCNTIAWLLTSLAGLSSLAYGSVRWWWAGLWCSWHCRGPGCSSRNDSCLSAFEKMQLLPRNSHHHDTHAGYQQMSNNLDKNTLLLFHCKNIKDKTPDKITFYLFFYLFTWWTLNLSSKEAKAKYGQTSDKRNEHFSPCFKSSISPSALVSHNP